MTRNHSSVSLSLSAVAMAVITASSPSWALDMTFSPKGVTKEINQKRWICKRCRSKVQSEGQIEVGVGVVSNSAYAFRNLVPSNNGEGAIAILSGGGKKINESGSSTKIEVTDLGLERFRIAAGYQSAGHGGAEISYQELPRYYSNQALTPYVAVAEQAKLPADWQPESTTGGMTTLNQSLQPKELKLLRKRLIINSDFRSDASLRPELKVRLEKQTGQRVSSGFLGTGTTNWVTPVDQQTLVMDAGLTKTSENGLLGLTYDGSLYKNQLDSQNWQNPYTVFISGTEYGQLGETPDNQAHQLSINGRYRWLSSQISARFAYGLQIQDQAFDPYTVNDSLLTTLLPAQSADAEVQTINADINASHRINREWRLTARLKVQDRDNQTKIYQFTPVVADTFVGSSSSNQAYSYRRESGALTAHYKGWQEFPIKLGYEYQTFHRSLGEREDTHDHQLWLGIKSKRWQSVVADAKLIAARRGGSDFTELADNQSDHLRRYNLADRDLLEARLSADWQVTDSVSSLFKTRFAEEHYNDTEVGLTDHNRFSVDWDWNWQVSELSSLYTGFGYQRLRYKQTGANSSGNPSWQGKLDDRTYSLMFGGDAKGLWLQPLDIGLDYVLSYGANQQSIELNINTGNGYPDNYYRNHTVNGWATYQLSTEAKIRFDVIYEHVDDRDYYWSNSQPDSLPTVLTLGNLSQNYSTWYAGVSYNHSF
ncbi:MtrB/PioB family decaheme-associated outer membrane protein [Photobacterium sp.]|uniref:MtrB/PioB family decaheme-associated outer membrane protein n=1 Tax=Photobacterium sp. TaxID=660 RepID=UPI00299E8228|nr:MtrB/PioB family decaheme-associated outer membrane protein [Photobacterium sp.]MDX1300717.1 MtrB/PioB family decaheme-associated outer membrane protein [Photobacterium sp.]